MYVPFSFYNSQNKFFETNAHCYVLMADRFDIMKKRNILVTIYWKYKITHRIVMEKHGSIIYQ